MGVAPDGAAERDTHLLAAEPAGDSTVAPPTFTCSDGLIGVYTSRGGASEASLMSGSGEGGGLHCVTSLDDTGSQQLAHSFSRCNLRPTVYTADIDDI